MFSIDDLKNKMEDSVHEYLLARASMPNALKKGYGKIELSFRITCENNKPSCFHNKESVEETIKP
tara:strand:+ start:1708 stop:1902 length:195 start_codon:yes stop_codon:yes gene_type:complete